jgi:hypothetical protein
MDEEIKTNLRKAFGLWPETFPTQKEQEFVGTKEPDKSQKETNKTNANKDKTKQFQEETHNKTNKTETNKTNANKTETNEGIAQKIRDAVRYNTAVELFEETNGNIVTERTLTTNKSVPAKGRTKLRGPISRGSSAHYGQIVLMPRKVTRVKDSGGKEQVVLDREMPEGAGRRGSAFRWDYKNMMAMIEAEHGFTRGATKAELERLERSAQNANTTRR